MLLCISQKECCQSLASTLGYAIQWPCDLVFCYTNFSTPPLHRVYHHVESHSACWPAYCQCWCVYHSKVTSVLVTSLVEPHTTCNVVCFWSDVMATILFAACLCTATIRGGYLFFGKPADIFDGWIRYIQIKQCRLLDAVSTCSPCYQPWKLLAQMQIALALAWWPSSEVLRTRVCVLRPLPVPVIWGQRLFLSEFPIVQLLFEGGVCLKKYGIKDSGLHDNWPAVQLTSFKCALTWDVRDTRGKKERFEVSENPPTGEDSSRGT